MLAYELLNFGCLLARRISGILFYPLSFDCVCAVHGLVFAVINLDFVGSLDIPRLVLLVEIFRLFLLVLLLRCIFLLFEIRFLLAFQKIAFLLL